MRILNILPYSPVPPHFGGALRIYHLLRAMASGHEVTVISFGSTAAGEVIAREIPGLREVTMIPPTPHLNGVLKRGGQAWAVATGRSAISLMYQSPEMERAINRTLRNNSFDVIQMENYPLGAYRLDEAGDALRILDAQNVEYDSAERAAYSTPAGLRKWFYVREAKNIRREETSIYGNQDALFVTSERDQALLDTVVPGVPKFVIPNGVDLGYFTPSPASINPASLVFTGSMNYYPNVDGVNYFLEEIFPHILRELPDAKITVVGSNPPKSLLKLRAPNVEITGYVEDVRPYIDRAAVYVVPLRMGGGTRLKVLEAMAMKKPVVTTTIGCEGIHLEHGTSVLIADDPLAFAASVVELVRNRSKAIRLLEHGHETVRRNYSWEAVGERLDEAYRTLARNSGTDPAAGPFRITGTS